MDKSKIVIILSLAVSIIDLLTIFFRRKIISKKFGTLEIEIPNKSNILKPVFTVVCCFILITILWVKKFDFFAVCIIGLCVVLGTELSVRDFITFKKNGVYQNAIVCDGQIIKFADILSFPLLNLSKEDFDAYEQSILIVQTRTKGSKSLIFPTAEDCKSIVLKIKDLHPQFKA